MKLGVKQIAEIAYMVDRAIQANAAVPVAVKTWRLATAAQPTWIQYVNNFLRRGTPPGLDAGAARDDAFAAILGVLSPRMVPGLVAGKTATFTVSPTTVTKAVAQTQQITTSAALDANGDAVSGEKYTYASSDATKATVSNTGLITAVATGAATITVTASSGATKTVAVTVS